MNWSGTDDALAAGLHRQGCPIGNARVSPCCCGRSATKCAILPILWRTRMLPGLVQGARPMNEHDVFVAAECPASVVRAAIEAALGATFTLGHDPELVPALVTGPTAVFFHDSHPFEDDTASPVLGTPAGSTSATLPGTQSVSSRSPGEYSTLSRPKAGRRCSPTALGATSPATPNTQHKAASRKRLPTRPVRDVERPEPDRRHDRGSGRPWFRREFWPRLGRVRAWVVGRRVVANFGWPRRP